RWSGPLSRGPDFVVGVRNCHGMSEFYAANSKNVRDVVQKVTAHPSNRRKYAIDSVPGRATALPLGTPRPRQSGLQQGSYVVSGKTPRSYATRRSASALRSKSFL